MSKLLKIIKKDETISLSIDQLQEFCGDGVIILQNEDIPNLTVEMFLNYGAMIVLFYPEENHLKIGHFVALTEWKGRLSYFDSYGLGIDQINSQEKHLSSLVNKLIRLGYVLETNQRQFQPLNDKSATCGRFACLRALQREMSNSEFSQWLDRPLHLETPDDIVSALTISIDLKK